MTSIWKTLEGGEAVRARYAQFLAWWPQPCVQHRIATSQGETFAIEHGADGAPEVVFLHGSASNALVWLRDAAAMGSHFKTYAIDMIGEPGLSAEARPPLASGAYMTWLDEVLTGLGVARCALVGISLGGWLALDYATHRPERVSAMVLLCPGGVGKHRNILLWAAPLLMLGPWGRRTFMRIVGMPAPVADPPPALKAFLDFNTEVHARFRPRRERLPQFPDAALQRLTMPVMAILGGRDAFIDAPGTRARLAANVPRADIRWLPEASHFLMGHTAEIDAFLTQAAGS